MFVYHRVPDTMQGTTLYPLNTLKEIYPLEYQRQVAKYLLRPHVLEYRIPPLRNCLWNDVLFLSPVHPALINRALRIAGHRGMAGTQFFEINLDSLDLGPDTTVIWLHKDSPENPDEYEPFDEDAFERLTWIPEKTIEYFQSFKSKGKRLLLFGYIPHVLYKGTIDTSTARITSV